MSSDKSEIGWRKDLLSETEKKKKRSSSSCSSSSSSSSPSSESDRKKRKKEKKERKEKRREERRLKKQQRAIEKAQKKEFKKALKRKRKEEKHNNSVPDPDPGPVSIKSSDDEGPDCSVPIDLMYTKSHAPQTKIEYDKKQSHIRRVVDPETGRSRLIKGDGEIIEEIVSKDRHREINKQATKEDGEYFQAKTIGWNPPK